MVNYCKFKVRISSSIDPDQTAPAGAG